MSRQEFESRVMRLTKRESSFLRRENALAKRSARNSEALDKLKSDCIQKFNKMKTSDTELRKMEIDIGKLSSVLQTYKEGTDYFEKEVKQLRVEQQQQGTEEDLQQSRMRTREGACLFKKYSNLFIGTDALPEAMQGLTLREKNHSSQLVAFNYNPFNHTQREVQSLIRGNLENNIYSKQWMELLFDIPNAGARNTQPSVESPEEKNK